MDSDTPQVYRLELAKPDDVAISHAVTALSRGELVILPTETVYGVAADPAVGGAINRLYAAKGRPESKPLPILISGIDQLPRGGVSLNAIARRLVDRFWPGPLTIVIESEAGSTGFRVPDHPVTLALLKAVGHGLAVTSANKSDEPPSQDAAGAIRALGPHVAVVLDAGPAEGGVPSTVVRVFAKSIEILREGAISVDDVFMAADIKR